MNSKAEFAAVVGGLNIAIYTITFPKLLVFTDSQFLVCIVKDKAILYVSNLKLML